MGHHSRHRKHRYGYSHSKHGSRYIIYNPDANLGPFRTLGSLISSAGRKVGQLVDTLTYTNRHVHSNHMFGPSHMPHALNPINDYHPYMPTRTHGLFNSRHHNMLPMSPYPGPIHGHVRPPMSRWIDDDDVPLPPRRYRSPSPGHHLHRGRSFDGRPISPLHPPGVFQGPGASLGRFDFEHLDNLSLEEVEERALERCEFIFRAANATHGDPSLDNLVRRMERAAEPLNLMRHPDGSFEIRRSSSGRLRADLLQFIEIVDELCREFVDRDGEVAYLMPREMMNEVLGQSRNPRNLNWASHMINSRNGMDEEAHMVGRGRSLRRVPVRL